jgi:phosphohistidine phosphatase SixA
MRHGDAGATSTDPLKERERGLTAEGRKIVEAIAREMRRQGEIPKQIFASEYTRTTETADVIGKILKIPVDLIDEIAPHAPIRALVERIAQDENIRAPMLVAHSDNLEPLFENLTGEDEDGFVKAEVRRLKIDRDSLEGNYKWRLLPSDLGLRDME